MKDKIYTPFKVTRNNWRHEEEDKSALGAFIHPKVHAIFLFIFGAAYMVKAYYGTETTTFGWIYFWGMVFFAVLIALRGVYEIVKHKV